MTVDRLPDQVGVAEVACVLLDHVHEDPAEGERLARLRTRADRLRLEPTVGESVVNDRVRTAYRLVEERPQRLRAVVTSRLELPVVIGVPVEGVEGRGEPRVAEPV